MASNATARPWLTVADADGDGVIAFEEFAAWVSGIAAAVDDVDSGTGGGDGSGSPGGGGGGGGGGGRGVSGGSRGVDDGGDDGSPVYTPPLRKHSPSQTLSALSLPHAAKHSPSQTPSPTLSPPGRSTPSPPGRLHFGRSLQPRDPYDNGSNTKTGISPTSAARISQAAAAAAPAAYAPKDKVDATMSVARPGRCCLPRPPSHFKPSFLVLNGILYCGEQHVPGPLLATSFTTTLLTLFACISWHPMTWQALHARP